MLPVDISQSMRMVQKLNFPKRVHMDSRVKRNIDEGSVVRELANSYDASDGTVSQLLCILHLMVLTLKILIKKMSITCTHRTWHVGRRTIS